MSAAAPTSSDPRRIRVVIVDDSSTTRWLLTQLLSSDPMIEVVGTAANAEEARSRIKALSPDVITLDVEMPGMNGIDFLRNLMRLRPMPVVMVSSLTERGADVTLEALALGAVEVVCKLKNTVSEDTVAAYASELSTKVRIASSARIDALGEHPAQSAVANAGSAVRNRAGDAAEPSRQLLAIGASTGGTEAIAGLLQGLPADGPGILIVQHISDFFNEAFVRRLNRTMPMRVVQAAHGSTIRRGHAYVAPAGSHLEIQRSGDGFLCVLNDEAPVNYHRPAADRLFQSVAAHAGPQAIGVLLTGMGSDGAYGMALMRTAGALTIAQDEETSVVWGMPGSAVRLGGVDEVLPLEDISSRLLKKWGFSS